MVSRRLASDGVDLFMAMQHFRAGTWGGGESIIRFSVAPISPAKRMTSGLPAIGRRST